ncbi:MAG: hypothetical protein JSW08_01630 [archaeon]|nr:MAG: hypothetical protein JSW08_01630 [archaeon]
MGDPIGEVEIPDDSRVRNIMDVYPRTKVLDTKIYGIDGYRSGDSHILLLAQQAFPRQGNYTSNVYALVPKDGRDIVVSADVFCGDNFVRSVESSTKIGPFDFNRFQSAVYDVRRGTGRVVRLECNDSDAGINNRTRDLKTCRAGAVPIETLLRGCEVRVVKKRKFKDRRTLLDRIGDGLASSIFKAVELYDPGNVS